MGSGGEERRGSEPTRGEAELEARLKRLEAGLGQARAESSPKVNATRAGADEPGPSPLGRAFRLSTEFVAGIIAGTLLGWSIDALAGTKPWGMIVFLMLGFAAGIYNVMRASGFLTPSKGRSTK